jgi:ABC-type Fe3+ transport system permease subunit
MPQIDSGLNAGLIEFLIIGALMSTPLSRAGGRMRAWNRWIAIFLALAGICLCLAAMGGFVLTILQNNLPWHKSQTIREHYQAVGDSYSQGFTAGFFLCFFMIMVVIAVSAVLDHRAGRRIRPGDPPLDGGRQL